MLAILPTTLPEGVSVTDYFSILEEVEVIRFNTNDKSNKSFSESVLISFITA